MCHWITVPWISQLAPCFSVQSMKSHRGPNPCPSHSQVEECQIIWSPCFKITTWRFREKFLKERTWAKSWKVSRTEQGEKRRKDVPFGDRSFCISIYSHSWQYLCQNYGWKWDFISFCIHLSTDKLEPLNIYSLNSIVKGPQASTVSSTSNYLFKRKTHIYTKISA